MLASDKASQGAFFRMICWRNEFSFFLTSCCCGSGGDRDQDEQGWQKLKSIELSDPQPVATPVIKVNGGQPRLLDLGAHIYSLIPDMRDERAVQRTRTSPESM